MENVTNLTNEELNQLKDLQQKQQVLVNNFGEIEFQIQVLELQKEKLVEQLETIKTEENQLANDLSKKYGNGSIDLEKGVIIKQ